MSDPERQPTGPESDADDRPSAGTNLILIYSLIAIALAAAIGFALMIVLPFHHRR